MAVEGEKIIKKTDGYFIRERGKRKENGNDGVGILTRDRILTRDNRSDFKETEVVGPDGGGRKRSGTLRELED